MFYSVSEAVFILTLSGMLGCLSDTCIGIGGPRRYPLGIGIYSALSSSSLRLLFLSWKTILSTFEVDQIATPLYVIIMAFRSLFVSALAAQASAVWLAGVNIAGCEIGIDTSVSDIVVRS